MRGQVQVVAAEDDVRVAVHVELHKGRILAEAAVHQQRRRGAPCLTHRAFRLSRGGRLGQRGGLVGVEGLRGGEEGRGGAVWLVGADLAAQGVGEDLGGGEGVREGLPGPFRRWRKGGWRWGCVSVSAPAVAREARPACRVLGSAGPGPRSGPRPSWSFRPFCFDRFVLTVSTVSGEPRLLPAPAPAPCLAALRPSIGPTRRRTCGPRRPVCVRTPQAPRRRRKAGSMLCDVAS